MRRPAVGGFVQHTIVTRQGITTQVVHRWPDQVGRPIELERTQQSASSPLPPDVLEYLRKTKPELAEKYEQRP